MQLEADVRAVRDEDAFASGRQALLLQRSQFLEEAGDVHDGAGADQVDAFRRYEARGQDVEIVGHGFMDDSVAGVFFGVPFMISLVLSLMVYFMKLYGDLL